MHAMFGRTSGGLREPLDRFDADHGRDRGNLEPTPGIAEVLFDGRYIEPAGNLLSDPNSEVLARGLEQSAALNLIFESFALGFGTLEDGVCIAERVGQRLVRKIVESGCDRRIGSLSHGDLHWLGLGLPWC